MKHEEHLRSPHVAVKEYTCHHDEEDKHAYNERDVGSLSRPRALRTAPIHGRVVIPGLAHAAGHARVSGGAGPRLAAVRVLAGVHVVRVHRVAPPTVQYSEGLERVIRRFLAIHALLTLKAALVEAGGVVLVLALRRERRKVVAARSTEGKRDGKWREEEALVARVASHRARHYRRGRRWALHALLGVPRASAGVV